MCGVVSVVVLKNDVKNEIAYLEFSTYGRGSMELDREDSISEFQQHVPFGRAPYQVLHFTVTVLHNLVERNGVHL